MLTGNTTTGGTANLCGLVVLVIGNTSANIINQLTQRSAYRHFNQTSVTHRASQSKDLCALALHSAEFSIPLTTIKNDGRHIGIGFNIIQHSGFTPQTFMSWERRTRTWLAAFAFDRGNQCSLLATYKRP